MTTDDTSLSSSKPASSVEQSSASTSGVAVAASESGSSKAASPRSEGAAGRAETQSEDRRSDDRRADERRSSSAGAGQSKLSLDGIVAGFVEAGRTMSPKLKELLAGTIALRVVDRSRAFLFGDFNGEFGVKESSGSESRSLQGDCMIDLSEGALVRIWRGDINPQIAMLSEKVTISGKSAMAVYFFNLAGR